MLLPVIVFPLAIYFERPTITTTITTALPLLLYNSTIITITRNFNLYTARGHSLRHDYVVRGSITISLRMRIDIMMIRRLVNCKIITNATRTIFCINSIFYYTYINKYSFSMLRNISKKISRRRIESNLSA